MGEETKPIHPAFAFNRRNLEAKIETYHLERNGYQIKKGYELLYS